jgi:ABC-type multidrug transport system permease subunit
MGDLGLVATQTRYSLVALFRTPRAVIFGVIFPPLLVVIFNSIFAKSGGAQVVHFNGTTLSFQSYFTAGIMAYAITLSSFSTLAITLTTQRENGQLKRYRGTPVPAWTFIAALVARSIAVTCLTVAATFAAGAAYGASISGAGVVGLVVYAVLGTATMCALGIGLTALTPTAEAASAIAPFSAVLLSFVSGVFVPIDQIGSTLADVGRVFPLAHLAEGLQESFAGVGGTGLDAGNVAALAAWALAAIVIAARRFKWEPHGLN